jgi:hypothetical protein
VALLALLTLGAAAWGARGSGTAFAAVELPQERRDPRRRRRPSGRVPGLEPRMKRRTA